MPIGVPVVRPSNTPDRMRTTSPSRRWLTKCEVPVRRRSTSCCRSASLSVQSRRAAVDDAAERRAVALAEGRDREQLADGVAGHGGAGAQDPRAGSCSRRSRNTPPPPRANSSHTNGRRGKARRTAAFCVADLDHQQSPGAQMPPRLTQDDAHRVQPVAPGGERDARLVPVLRGQTAQLRRSHVRRIRHDDIVGGAAQSAEVIRSQQPHAPREAVAPHVVARHLERRRRDVDRVDPGPRQRQRAGDGDAARAGAEVEHAPHPRRIDPRRKAPLDELGDRRARNQHPRIDRAAAPRQTR